jgi:predicted nucleotidyltransferase
MTIALHPEELPAVCAEIAFPTETHRALACETAVALSRDARVTAVCLTCSIARGMADRDADLDMAVFTAPEHVAALAAIVDERQRASSEIWFDLAVSDGEVRPGEQSWMNVDGFELEVGNMVAYARPLFERDGAFQRLRSRHLPYCDEALAVQRGERFREVTINHVHRVRRGLGRGSMFDPAERLRLGIQTFLAGLFVCRRVYPVDYAKWVEHQVTDLLGLPELLPSVRALFDVGPLDPDRLRLRAGELEALAEQWLIPATPSRDRGGRSAAPRVDRGALPPADP